MNTALIAKSYWRSLLRGVRAFESVPEALREEVLALARQAAERGEAVPSGLPEIQGQEERKGAEV